MSLPPINQHRGGSYDFEYEKDSDSGYVAQEVGVAHRRQLTVCVEDEGDGGIGRYNTPRERDNNPYRSTKCMDHHVIQRMQDDVQRQRRRKNMPRSGIPDRGVLYETDLRHALKNYQNGSDRGVYSGALVLPAIRSSARRPSLTRSRSGSVQRRPSATPGISPGSSARKEKRDVSACRRRPSRKVYSPDARAEHLDHVEVASSRAWSGSRRGSSSTSIAAMQRAYRPQRSSSKSKTRYATEEELLLRQARRRSSAFQELNDDRRRRSSSYLVSARRLGDGRHPQSSRYYSSSSSSSSDSEGGIDDFIERERRRPSYSEPRWSSRVSEEDRRQQSVERARSHDNVCESFSAEDYSGW